MEILSLRNYFSLIICLLSFNCKIFTFASKTNPQIIIVGAGAAGIAAATALVDYGFKNVTVLELKTRIGGRIHTKKFGENVIDLGAQWVCAKRGNVIDEIATKHELIRKSLNKFRSYSYLRSNGELVPALIWERLQNITLEIERLSQNNISNYNGSLGMYMKMKFDEMLSLPANADIDKTIAQEYYDTYDKKASSDRGTDSLDVISVQGIPFRACENGIYIDCQEKGNIEILKALMESHKTGYEYGKLEGKIKLSKVVTKIQWQRENEKAIIQTTTNETFEADHVILTVSLGVLKSNINHLFEPTLPAAKVKAIKLLGFSGVNKVFLEFEKPFWPSDWHGAYFLWREDDLKQIRGTEYAWIEDIFGFQTITPQSNILVAWVIGNGGRLMETLSKDNIKLGCLYALNAFFPPDEKKIINIENSAWTSDVGFRGGYSYHSLETEKENVTNDQLAEPITLTDDKPIILFAGEATERLHYGTVHGAVESGQREARRLQDYYKKVE